MKKKLLWTLVFTVFALGYAQAQNIDVTGLGIVIPGDASNTPSIADDTEFGTVDVGGTPVTHTFTINNLTGDVIILGLNSLSNSTDFSQSTSPTPNFILGGQSSTFTVTFDPQSTGLKGSVVSVSALNATTLITETYTFNIQGTGNVPQVPNINVLGNSTLIASGDTTPSTTDDTYFGPIDVTSGAATHTFTILNSGSAELNITNTLIVGGNGDFTITSQPTSPIPAGNLTTFNVQFDPSTTGNISATVFILSDDPDTGVFAYAIGGEGTTPALEPEVDVTGNGISIASGDNTPSATDDTYFGIVDVVAGAVTHTFTITNLGAGDLNLNSNVLVSGSSDFTITNQPTTPIPPAGSTTFDVTFDPSTTGSISATILFLNNDSDEGVYTFTVQGIGSVSEPEMDLFDNSNAPLASGGIVDFGQQDVASGSLAYTFTIQNNGLADLNLTDPSPYVSITGANASDFTLTTVPGTPIASSGSTTFVITFDPSAMGSRTATVSIANNDTNENPYTFTILGEGIDANASTPLLITQYYEGANYDRWIEIKNISQSPVIGGNYSIGLYHQNKAIVGVIENADLDGSYPVGQNVINPGDVLLFRNPLAVGPTNLGTAIVFTAENNGYGSSVCDFNGNDVIIIYPTGSATPYNDRIDIMGIVDTTTPGNWGQDVSYTKGCGTSISPSTTFNGLIDNNGGIFIGDYIRLDLAEVNTALTDQNIALGTFDSNPTAWTTSWSNGTPDRTRNTVINGTYTGDIGSLETCDLTINGTLDYDHDSGNNIDVSGDLNITGSFIIGDTESLTFGIGNLNENATISGQIVKIDRSTTLSNINDYTYWSSPVQTTIENIFSSPSESVANLNKVYYWNPAAEYSFNGYDFIGQWEQASGSTRAGKGFISQGPTGGSYPTQHTLYFTGSPYNGTVENDMYFIDDGDDHDDYNLVGNPYPSAINANQYLGLEENQNTIDGTIWFWTHSTVNNGGEYNENDYVAYNWLGGSSNSIDSIIGSSQGFMARAVSNGIASFTNSMRLKDQNTQFFRGVETKKAKAYSEKDRIWLNITSSQGGASDELLVGFVDKATDGFDRGYDGLKNSAGWISFYSVLDSLPYAIQGLSSFDLNKKVTLGFETYIAEPLSYTISIDAIEGVLKDNDVYLVDNELGLVHDLKQSPYSFDDEGYGYFPQRFTLQFTKSTLGVEDLKIADNDFMIINNENDLNIRSKGAITNIKMYDLLGRLLVEKSPNNTDFDISTEGISKGTVLLLNATFENGSEVKKKTIRY